MGIKQSNNGKVYNLALCDEGKKVKMFLQLDIDGDGEADAVTSFVQKKLGGDVEAACIDKLRKFFAVFGFPRVLIVLSTLKVDVERWKKGFSEIKQIDVMKPEKTNEVPPVETWFLTSSKVHNTLNMALRNDKKIQAKQQFNMELPDTSLEGDIKDFLIAAIIESQTPPKKIVNETPGIFNFFNMMLWGDFTIYNDMMIEIIKWDNVEHLLIKVKDK